MEIVTKLLSEMISPYKEDAKKLLRPNADFSKVCYAEKKDEENGTYDGNHTTRCRVLTGIQFMEDNANYEDVIRYLLIEEIKHRKANSFQGFGYALNLSVWLIKQFDREQDADLFSRAQYANFDTYCGFNPDAIHEDFFKRNISEINIDEAVSLAVDLQEYDYLGLRTTRFSISA